MTRPPPDRPPHGPGRQRHDHGPARDRQLRTSTDEPLVTRFDVTVVDGERGRHLAVVQARAIREVLQWWTTVQAQRLETSSAMDDAA